MDPRLRSLQAEVRVGLLPTHTNVLVWLADQALPDGKLLAHAYDGVVWGHYQDGKMFTASSSSSLHEDTFQQVRFFSLEQEIHLWKDDIQWRYRWIIDGPGDITYLTFDEHQLLWGNYTHQTEGGFTELEDGSQGLNHFVPVSVVFRQRPDELRERIALRVRNYLSEYAHRETGSDDIDLLTTTGVNYIAHSRLVDIEVVKAEVIINE